MLRVRLSRVEDNPYQPRTMYRGIEELAASVEAMRGARPATSGLLQVPVGRLVHGDGSSVSEDELIAAGGEGFAMSDPDVRVQLVVGHRRLRAFRCLAARDEGGEYGTMPIDLTAMDDVNMYLAGHVENGEREDLNPIEKAQSYQRALDEFGWTQRELAENVSIDEAKVSRSAVANALRLLRLPASGRRAVCLGELTARHGRALVSYADLPEDVFAEIVRDVVPVARPEDGVIERIKSEKRFHLYLRRRLVDRDEDLSCFVCGRDIVPSPMGRVHFVGQTYSWDPLSDRPVCLVCGRFWGGWKLPAVGALCELIQPVLDWAGNDLEDTRYFRTTEPIEGANVVQSLCEGCPSEHKGICYGGDCWRAKEELVRTGIENDGKEPVLEEYGFVPTVTTAWVGSEDFRASNVADRAMFDERYCFKIKCEHCVLRWRGGAEYDYLLYPVSGYHLTCDNKQRKTACQGRWLEEERPDVVSEERVEAEAMGVRKRVAQSYADRCLQVVVAGVEDRRLELWCLLATKIRYGRSKPRTMGGALKAVARALLEPRDAMGHYTGNWNEGDDERAIAGLQSAMRQLELVPPEVMPEREALMQQWERLREHVTGNWEDLSVEQVTGALVQLEELDGRVSGDAELAMLVSTWQGRLEDHPVVSRETV